MHYVQVEVSILQLSQGKVLNELNPIALVENVEVFATLLCWHRCDLTVLSDLLLHHVAYLGLCC